MRAVPQTAAAPHPQGMVRWRLRVPGRSQPIAYSINTVFSAP
jgi:hypothetical protein